MPRRTPHQKLAAQATELAVAVPQVIAHRVTRMALAGHTPSRRDQVEFSRMVEEKTQAFGESWQAMAVQAVQAQQTLAVGWFKALAVPSATTATTMATQWQNAALGVLGKGLAPVHRKAVANAKRLGRTKLR